MKSRYAKLSFVVATGALAACSVDTSDVHFVPDDVLNSTGATSVVVGTGNVGNVGTGGDIDGTGGVVNTGGVPNVGGMPNKAGAPGTAGYGTGGVNPTAGASSFGGTGGGFPSGGTSGRCQMRIGNPTELLIDDVEDGDAKLPMFGGREGGWYVSNDGSPFGMQKPAPNMPPPPDKPGSPPRAGAAATSAAMHMSGSGFTDWGANMGLTLYLPPGAGGACPYDVSPHRGVRFWIKSMLPNSTVRFVIPTVETHAPAQGGTCARDCGDHFGVKISPVPVMWTQFEVEFAKLSQAGVGTASRFYPNHALNVEWSVGFAEDFDFWVDQIEFY